MTNAEPKSLSGTTAEFLRYLVRDPTQTPAITSDSMSCVVLFILMDTLKQEAYLRLLNVKSACLIKHRTKNAYGGITVQLHSFLTLAHQIEKRGQLHAVAALRPGKGSSVGLRSGADVMEIRIY
jgi:hypothetical protein